MVGTLILRWRLYTRQTNIPSIKITNKPIKLNLTFL
jgi:hypothetical protein